MGLILTVIVAGLVLGVVFSVNQQKKIKAGTDAMRSNLETSGFVISKEVVANKGKLFVDDVNKKWTIYQIATPTEKVFKYSDLLEFEVYEDGNSIAKGRAGSALVGGLLLGVAGAVIGSAGSKKQHNTCKTLQVRIRVNDLQRPELIVPFLDAETKKSSIIYKQSFENAKNFAATLSYIQSNATTQVQVNSN